VETDLCSVLFQLIFMRRPHIRRSSARTSR
jgi:hypothetical protein